MEHPITRKPLAHTWSAIAEHLFEDLFDGHNAERDTSSAVTIARWRLLDLLAQPHIAT